MFDNMVAISVLVNFYSMNCVQLITCLMIKSEGSVMAIKQKIKICSREQSNMKCCVSYFQVPGAILKFF